MAMLPKFLTNYKSTKKHKKKKNKRTHFATIRTNLGTKLEIHGLIKLYMIPNQSLQDSIEVGFYRTNSENTYSQRSTATTNLLTMSRIDSMN
jgi:hypothetical protein